MKSFLLIALLGLGMASVGCGGAGPTPTTAPPPTVGTAAEGLQVILANSVHVVGPNRFPVGVVRAGRSVKDAQVQLTFYDLTSGAAVAAESVAAEYYGDNLGEAGVYVARTNFSKPGTWGVEATVTEPGRAPESVRIGFDVLPSDPSPGIGDDAPRSKNLTLSDVNGDR
jgi:hypothetical protein